MHPTLPARTHPAIGHGWLRERRPGIWEIRFAIGADPVTGASRQRSFTLHGTATDAEESRRELVTEHLAARLPPARQLRVDELLDAWLVADHPWKPSTLVGYRSNVGALRDAAIASARVVTLTPHQVRTALARWYAEGATLSVVGGRFRVLRSAVGWAYDERILQVHPLRTMRGPGRPAPRRPIDADDIRVPLATAEPPAARGPRQRPWNAGHYRLSAQCPAGPAAGPVGRRHVGPSRGVRRPPHRRPRRPTAPVEAGLEP